MEGSDRDCAKRIISFEVSRPVTFTFRWDKYRENTPCPQARSRTASPFFNRINCNAPGKMTAFWYSLPFSPTKASYHCAAWSHTAEGFFDVGFLVRGEVFLNFPDWRVFFVFTFRLILFPQLDLALSGRKTYNFGELFNLSRIRHQSYHTRTFHE